MEVWAGSPKLFTDLVHPMLPTVLVAFTVCLFMKNRVVMLSLLTGALHIVI